MASKKAMFSKLLEESTPKVKSVELIRDLKITDSYTFQISNLTHLRILTMVSKRSFRLVSVLRSVLQLHTVASNALQPKIAISLRIPDMTRFLLVFTASQKTLMDFQRTSLTDGMQCSKRSKQATQVNSSWICTTLRNQCIFV